MKNIKSLNVFYVLVILLTTLNLYGVTSEISIIKTNFHHENDFSIPELNENQYIDFEQGNPSIPVQTYWFLLEQNQKISHADVKVLSSFSEELEYPLLPVQKQSPISLKTQVEVTRAYNTDVFPGNIIYRTGNGYSGSRNIGFVSFYTGSYNTETSEYTGYNSIRIDIETEYCRTETLPANLVSDDVTKMLTGIEVSQNTSLDHLIITERQFTDEFQRLIEWRKSQGYNSRIATIENIYYNVPGSDLQEKIRSFIKYTVQNSNIDYVTLAGDTDAIPHRAAFAFDATTSSSSANDIPCDMYYSCLDGDWNANGNDVYGEDDDNVDYFPDVYVSRLSVTASDEVENYITKMINYEKGESDNYEKAAGFSMELWSESNSESAQQYIYDRYFPQNFQIDFHYGDNNTDENFFNTLNSSYNITQHTGHANKNILALGDGHYVRNNDIDMLNNDFCGMFYTIGCWSAAIDYDSIGEKFITTPNSFSGYIGNTRYGWGAPASPAFGFSEFYQKAFFRNMFERDIRRIAQGNALQKLDFIPYMTGTSVYKWVAYELIALGDAPYKLYLNNPSELNVTQNLDRDQIVLHVTDNSEPVAGCYAVHGYNSGYTDYNGDISFPRSASSDSISVYHENYQPYSEHVDSSNTEALFEIDSNIPEFIYSQDSLTFTTTITNNSTEDKALDIVYIFDSNNVDITATSFHTNVNSGTQSMMGFTNVKLAENSAVKPGDTITFDQILYDNDVELIRKRYSLLIKGSHVSCIQFRQNFNSRTLNFRVGLTGTDALTNLDVTLSDNDYVHFNQNQWTVTDLQRSYIDLQTTFDPTIITRDQSSVYLTFNFSNNTETYSLTQEIIVADDNNIVYEDFESLIDWQQDIAWEQVQTFAYSGNYSLSCHPAVTSLQIIETPALTFSNGMDLSFQYKYQMPMYGTHGVFVTLETESRCDTLIFLGAGGALGGEEEEFAIIESDWAEYRIDINDFLIDDLSEGEIFSIKLGFNYADSLDGFDYISDPENGVFIDEFQLGSTPQIVSEDNHEIVNNNGINVTFNNPALISSGNCKFSISTEKALESLSIYNIKGQKVKSWKQAELEERKNIFWNYQDNSSKIVANGVYFIRAKSANCNKTMKMVIIK